MCTLDPLIAIRGNELRRRLNPFVKLQYIPIGRILYRLILNPPICRDSKELDNSLNLTDPRSEPPSYPMYS
jgi:hypothetical protein